MKNLKITLLLAASICGILQASDNPTEKKYDLFIQTLRPGGPTLPDPFDRNRTINNRPTTVISIPYSGAFADIIRAYEQKNPTPEGHAVAIKTAGHVQTPNMKYAYGESDDKKNTFDRLGKEGNIFAKVEKIIRWDTQATGDPFPNGLKLSIQFIPTYGIVQYLKEKIRALVPMIEQNYTVDITKNGKTLKDSDIILPDQLNTYGIVLNKAKSPILTSTVSPSAPKTKASASWWSLSSIQKALSNWWNKK